MREFIGPDLFDVLLTENPTRWPWHAWINFPLVPLTLIASWTPLVLWTTTPLVPLLFSWPPPPALPPQTALRPRTVHPPPRARHERPCTATSSAPAPGPSTKSICTHFVSKLLQVIAVSNLRHRCRLFGQSRAHRLSPSLTVHEPSSNFRSQAYFFRDREWRCRKSQWMDPYLLLYSLQYKYAMV